MITVPRLISPLIQTILEWQGRMDTEQAESLAREVTRFVSRAGDFGECFEGCESAAERQFFLGICCSDLVSVQLLAGPSLQLTHVRSGLNCLLSTQLELWDPDLDCSVHAGSQDPCSCVPPAIARIDFALRTFNGDPLVGYAVEIDGHDFHEKTKAQARTDRQRERWIIRHPHAEIDAVLRFTGSEIFADPVRCAEEALGQFFWKLSARKLALALVVDDATRGVAGLPALRQPEETQEAAE